MTERSTVHVPHAFRGPSVRHLRIFHSTQTGPIPFVVEVYMGTLLFVNQRVMLRRALQIECQVVRERDFKLLGRRTMDLSPDGMLVPTDLDVLTGEEVLVAFKGPKTGTWFDCEATVARILHGRRPGDRGRALGLTFHGMDEITRLMLRANLRGFPPPVPRRAQRVDYARSVRMAAFV